MADLLVVGAGLIGTSVALAVAADRDVVLSDADPARTAEAVARGAGRPWDGREGALHAVLATPPAVVAPRLVELQGAGVAATWSHVSSTQVRVQQDAQALGADTATLCGAHPLAGSERSGPSAARATLFAGRPWVLCPSERSSPEAVRDADELARACGAEVSVLSAREHDDAVALVSHLPQVAASAVAARLLGHEAAARLSGPGLQDTTRVAAGDPDLWAAILGHNAERVAPLVEDLARDLAALAAALRGLGTPGGSEAAVRDLLERGRRGRLLVPVKRGAHDADFVALSVRVADRPGRLAALLADAAAAEVNVEDVRVEHLPGRPTGVIDLMVAAGAKDALAAALRAGGWDVV